MDAQVAAHLGELAALTAALCWSLNSLAFEAAGRRVGSLAVNYLRIFVAFPLLTLTAWLTRGLALPLDAPPQAWLWLSISGLVGFVFGDIFLFRAFVEIGSRISLLIRSLGPPITALLSFLLLGERLAPRGLVGIFLVTLGISLVILGRSPQEKKVRLNRPLKGVIYAALGAVGEALGMVLSKLGMGSYNALAATQIRLLAGPPGPSGPALYYPGRHPRPFPGGGRRPVCPAADTGGHRLFPHLALAGLDHSFFHADLQRKSAPQRSSGSTDLHCRSCFAFPLGPQHLLDALQGPIDLLFADHQRRGETDGLFAGFLAEESLGHEPLAEGAGRAVFGLDLHPDE